MFLSLKALSVLLSLSVVVAKPIKEDDDATAQQGLKRYIVIYDDDSKPGTMSDFDAQVMVEDLGGTVNFHFETVLNGMVVTLPSQDAASLMEQDPRIVSVTEDMAVSLNPPKKPFGANSQTEITPLANLPWNLDRVDQPDLPLDKSYKWHNNLAAGSDVHVCVIDTGIDPYYYNVASEIKFGGGKNFVPDKKETAINDCNGHGTHVAGTVGSKSYGIAPGVTIWVARVLDCDGSGYFSYTIAALDWCATMGKGKKMVMNLSLGGDPYSPVDEAVAKARDKGIIVVVAAGNDNGDACKVSPAREPKAITVGATGSGTFGVYSDVRASFSNFGTCTDIFAPGTQTPSLKLNDPSKPVYFQGTSMAAPCVAGVAALFFSQHATANETETAMLTAAIDSVGNSKSTHNLLVQIPGTPTRKPTGQPTLRPTAQPTPRPTPRPTGQPTSRPTRQPTSRPTRRPTRQPTSRPTRQPTGQPTRRPTGQPTTKT